MLHNEQTQPIKAHIWSKAHKGKPSLHSPTRRDKGQSYSPLDTQVCLARSHSPIRLRIVAHLGQAVQTLRHVRIGPHARMHISLRAMRHVCVLTQHSTLVHAHATQYDRVCSPFAWHNMSLLHHSCGIECHHVCLPAHNARSSNAHAHALYMLRG